MSTKLIKLLQSGRTVFTLDDLGVIWGQKNRSTTRQSARDYASRGDLVRIKQGVYALSQTAASTVSPSGEKASRITAQRIESDTSSQANTTLSRSDTYVIANKLLVPSYVTGLSILIDAGLSFQYTGKVFCVAAYNKSYELGERTFVYSQVKASVLYNPLGLDRTGQVNAAGLERAITDLIYLSKGRYPFERIANINWDLLDDCAKIYDCSFVQEAVDAIKQRYTLQDTTTQQEPNA